MSDQPGTLIIKSRSTAIHVVARAEAPLSVAGGVTTVLANGDNEITPSIGSSVVEVECPAGTNVTIATLSGRVALAGPLGQVRVATRSGRVDVDTAEGVEVRSATGGVHLGACSGHCSIVVKSAKVVIDKALSAAVSSMSGRVELAGGTDAKVQTISGAVKIAAAAGSSIKAQSVSGSIDVSVPTGTNPHATLASIGGKVRNACPEGDDGLIEVRTVSGAISVTGR